MLSGAANAGAAEKLRAHASANSVPSVSDQLWVKVFNGGLLRIEGRKRRVLVTNKHTRSHLRFDPRCVLLWISEQAYALSNSKFSFHFQRRFHWLSGSHEQGYMADRR